MMLKTKNIYQMDLDKVMLKFPYLKNQKMSLYLTMKEKLKNLRN